MKKFLRRITLLALVATMFIMPASTALAASTPELVIDIPGVKYFEYQPSPYFVASGQSPILKDTTTSDGCWDVPAGKSFRCQIDVDRNTTVTFRVLIVSSSSGISYDQVVTGSFAICDIPAKATDTCYQVWVVAYSDINIYGYGGYCLD